jgi:serine/threonine protein kinase
LKLEYCPNDLFELTKRVAHSEPANKKPFILGLPLTRFLIRKIAETIAHIHCGLGMAHLDIKVENVLFDQDCNIKLCDFGFSQDIKTRIFESLGTPSYMAPE